MPGVGAIPGRAIHFLSNVAPSNFVSCGRAMASGFGGVFVVGSRDFTMTSLVVGSVEGCTLGGNCRVVALGGSFFPGLVSRVVVPALSLTFIARGHFVAFSYSGQHVRSHHFVSVQLLRGDGGHVGFGAGATGRLLGSTCCALGRTGSIRSRLRGRCVGTVSFGGLGGFTSVFYGDCVWILWYGVGRILFVGVTIVANTSSKLNGRFTLTISATHASVSRV